jgi:hypothetical protein
MAVRVKGLMGVRQVRPRYRTLTEARQIIVPFVGPFSALQKSEPPTGAPFSGFPPEYLVKEVNLIPGESANGRMEVVLEKLLTGADSGASFAAVGDPVFERDWGEERRPLEEHKKCGKLKADRPYYESPGSATSDSNPALTSPGAKNCRRRTWDEWDVLDEDDYEAVDGGWSLTQYKAIRESGHSDYPVAYPICIKTTYHRSRPTDASASGVYKKSTPPTECLPPSVGWVYVKTVDRISRSGRLYTRTQQWRGYDKTQDLFFLT